MKYQKNIYNQLPFLRLNSSSSLLACLVVLCLVLAGCKRGSNITGKWELDTAKMSTGSNTASAMLKGLSGLMTLDFESNGQYTQTELGLKSTGTYKVEGDKLEMTETDNGTAKPVNPGATITNGGNTIMFTSGAKPVYFKRASS